MDTDKAYLYGPDGKFVRCTPAICAVCGEEEATARDGLTKYSTAGQHTYGARDHDFKPKARGRVTAE